MGNVKHALHAVEPNVAHNNQNEQGYDFGKKFFLGRNIEQVIFNTDKKYDGKACNNRREGGKATRNPAAVQAAGIDKSKANNGYSQKNTDSA